MDPQPLQPKPRVVLARESLWKLTVPNNCAERALLHERRKELVLSAYAIYSDVDGLRDFDVYVQPVLRTIASSRSRSMLTLALTPATFDAGLLRHALASANELGIPSMVEVRDLWGRTMLELLAAARPTYVRLSPEFVHGAGAVPDVFRAMVTFGEFARARGLQLVARNPRDDHEVDAARVAGIALVQWGSLPFFRDESDGLARPTLLR
ncbi:MAG: hypothetical protein IT359_08230 [Gemmatimonadaceae bacterium]|nr:hypothetical protein [Gemmatimonadaceae bacterium]